MRGADSREHNATAPSLTPQPLPRRALELLRATAGPQRAAAAQAAAAEAAETGVGEADLRRVKRQFSTLKNSFVHYEVKNEFLAGARGCGA